MKKIYTWLLNLNSISGQPLLSHDWHFVPTKTNQVKKALKFMLIQIFCMSVTILAEINFMYHLKVDELRGLSNAFFSDEWQDSECLSEGLLRLLAHLLWFNQHLWSKFKFLRNEFNLNNTHKIRVCVNEAHSTTRHYENY